MKHLVTIVMKSGVQLDMRCGSFTATKSELDGSLRGIEYKDSETIHFLHIDLAEVAAIVQHIPKKRFSTIDVALVENPEPQASDDEGSQE